VIQSICLLPDKQLSFEHTGDNVGFNETDAKNGLVNIHFIPDTFFLLDDLTIPGDEKDFL